MNQTINGYVIPPAVERDFAAFKQHYQDYKDKKLDDLAFKTIRVPFGIYEQREAGTFMVRVKLAGGVITPEQLGTLAALSLQYANGRLHVTTRGGAQLHYVKFDDFLAVIGALHAAGVSPRGGGGNTVRNITADPYAGVADDEAFDVTPHTLALTTRMLAQKDSYALPRKFKISFSGSPADRGGATFIDAGFIARVRDGQRGFTVYIAGGQGAKSREGRRFIEFLPEGEVFALTQAIKEVFDERGNRKNKHAARLRFLVAELGLEEFRWLVEEKIALVKSRGDWQLNLTTQNHEAAKTQSIVEKRLLSAEEKLWWQRFVTPQKQRGYYSAKVPLLLGDLPADGARELAGKLASLAAGRDVIRLGADQNLYLRNLTAGELLELYPVLKKLSPLTERPAVIGDIVVCTGAATCQLGITIPRGALPVIERALLAADVDLDRLQGFRINISGCPNSCGRHNIADLGFFGKVLRNDGVPYPAYNILVGAKIGEGVTRYARKIAADISAYRLPQFIVSVAHAWLDRQRDYPTFADWVDAGGEATMVQLAKNLAGVPSFDEDKNPYYDYSAREVFSLKGRGAGECSAGMYDLIEADKKALIVALTEPLTPANLANIRLLAARMLLITRGEEARSEKEVLAAFQKHFIDRGLVEQKFAPLLLGDATPAVVDLASAVIALYGTMDNTLKFTVEKPPAPAAQVTVSAKFKDYRGVACPMNFVKTKMDLATMPSGELLEILLDDGAPIDNVPKSVAAEGHQVESQTKEGAAWRVRIRKK
ncbi:MAG: sulfurtransferase TusA family protein [Verrucomicrobiales bacterium]|jgi:sulfite reductase (ferredoxin)|nr:sulfurtransferase TusA family protein [Verrucomicrobiales bacterium]